MTCSCWMCKQAILAKFEYTHLFVREQSRQGGSGYTLCGMLFKDVHPTKRTSLDYTQWASMRADEELRSAACDACYAIAQRTPKEDMF